MCKPMDRVWNLRNYLHPPRAVGLCKVKNNQSSSIRHGIIQVCCKFLLGNAGKKIAHKQMNELGDFERLLNEI